MAKTREFHALYSRTTGKPVETIRDYAKVLTKAGYMPPTKRGRGAVGYNTRAAVALLLAVLFSPSRTQAAETVERIEALGLRKIAGEDLGIELLQNLGLSLLDNMGTALRALVDAMRRGEYLTNGVFVDITSDGENASIYMVPSEGTKADDFGLFYGPHLMVKPVMRYTRLNEKMLGAVAYFLDQPDE